MTKTTTELVFILDKSGSMGGLESDTIGGFNSMLNKQKALDDECRITTVLFDNNYELLHDRIDIQAVNPITEKDYYVGGSTALLDAIGITLQKIIRVAKYTAKEDQAPKVIFVIITDGMENASRQYSSQKIKSMIEEQKTEYGWEFIFLGANIDAVETASHYGVSADRAMNYVPDQKGTSLNFKIMSQTVESFRKCGYVRDDAFDEIRKDHKQRGK